MTDELKHEIKSKNDQLISEKGYRFNNFLPILETPTLRNLAEIKGRMSVLNALINIAFEAPTYLIKDWIESHNLSKYLSDFEKEILETENEDLTQLQTNTLLWNLESLWALMWLTEMIDTLEPEEFVDDSMAELLPNLQENESNEKLENVENIRQELDIYTKLDYYYRLHWYCVDERINGRESKLNEGIIYERRKALEWAFNRESDWDNVEMST